MVHYLTASDLYNINDSVMQGHTFVRDTHLLRSAASRPSLCLFGQEQFPTLLDKAAALLHSLAYHHLFADGNKRTAVLAVTHFLRANGLEAAWPEQEAADFVLAVARGNHDIPNIAGWLARHTRPRE